MRIVLKGRFCKRGKDEGLHNDRTATSFVYENCALVGVSSVNGA